MITKKDFDYIKDVASREDSFDWDIPNGYIQFGTYAIGIHKLIKKVWHEKYVSDWKNLSYKQIMDAIKEQEWMIEE